MSNEVINGGDEMWDTPTHDLRFNNNSISYGWANITKISTIKTRHRIFQVKFCFSVHRSGGGPS